MTRHIKRRVTLAEVSALAGVSRSAVSRTFTAGASVSDKTRERVLSAANQLGYRPNILARSLTTGQTSLVGLVANNFHNPAYLEIFDIFTQLLQAKGLRPLLINLTDEIEPNRSLDLLLQYQVDAVILASSTLSVEFASAFAQAGLPVVHTFGRGHLSEYDVVGIDNLEAGRLAARRLLASGYRSIGFLGGPEEATSTKFRLQGFLEVLEARSDVKIQINFASGYTFEAGYTKMDSMRRKPLAQAYFCGDDIISFGAISALHRAGYRVPESVGILGFNDIEMAAWESIRLTTVKQPFRQIIESSVERIALQLQPDRVHQPSVQLFPCEVIERGTLPKIL